MDGGPSIQEREDLSQSLIPDEDGGSGCYYSLCHPKGRLHRFVALFFMCFIGFGKLHYLVVKTHFLVVIFVML